MKLERLRTFLAKMKKVEKPGQTRGLSKGRDQLKPSSWNLKSFLKKIMRI